jgi:hypothetical protein
VCGLFFLSQNRLYEAIAVFGSLYRHLLQSQRKQNRWIHKGMPLVWISDAFFRMRYLVHSKRYLTYTLCEDTVNRCEKLRAVRETYMQKLVNVGGSVRLNHIGSTAYRLPFHVSSAPVACGSDTKFNALHSNRCFCAADLRGYVRIGNLPEHRQLLLRPASLTPALWPEAKFQCSLAPTFPFLL